MNNVLVKCLTNKPRKSHGIHSQSDFKSILIRERTRSDRNGCEFSVLVFDTAHPFFKNNAGASQVLIEEIINRKRCTDEIGFFSPHEIGLFLPDTGAYGADFVAHDICTRLSLPKPCYMIFTYPSEDEKDSEHSENKEHTQSPDIPEANLENPAPQTPSLDWYFMHAMPFWKRVFDIVGSSFLLILFSPVMLLAAAAIKLTSPGPIIFMQKRVGRGGKPFDFYKFRSMIENADAMKKTLLEQNEQAGPVFKIKNDPRVTPVGHILRKTSIDELPQLWNVLKGDMSLVGPRPPTVDEVPRYHSWQRRRLDLTGGLTCLWQVSGRSNVGFEDWMRMDLDYIHKKSFLLDLKLLLKTPIEVLRGRGAH